MKLEEIIAQIPEADRADVLAEVRQATSTEDVAAIAERYGVEIDAQVVLNKFSGSDESELDDEALEKVAGGFDWAAAMSDANCSCMY